MQACSNSHALMQDSIDLQQDTGAVESEVSSDPSGVCTDYFSYPNHRAASPATVGV